MHSVLEPVSFPGEEHDLLLQLAVFPLEIIDPVLHSIRRLHDCEQGVAVPARARPPTPAALRTPQPSTPRATLSRLPAKR